MPSRSLYAVIRVAFCCLTVACWTPGVCAADGALFQTDFESSSLDAWELVSGTWQVAGGVLHSGAGSEAHFATVTGDGWTDYSAQVRVKMLGSANSSVDWLKAYLFARVQDRNNFYRFGFHGDARCVDLYRCQDGKWTSLGSAVFQPERDRWYVLRIEVVGPRIRGFVDGELVLERRDDQLSRGTVGLGCTEDHMLIAWDDLRVESLGRSGVIAATCEARLLVNQTLTVGIDAIEVSSSHEQLRASVAMFAGSSNSPVREVAATPFDSQCRATAEIHVAQVPPGEYRLAVRVCDPQGHEVARTDIPCVLPERPAWLGSTAGISDRVLPPWTPLEIGEDPPLTVRCWGRAYEFSGSWLPTQIITAANPLLAAPTTLIAVIDGQAAHMETGVLRVARQTPAEVVLDGARDLGGISIAAVAKLEYDGMLRLDCTLTPGQDRTLNELILEVLLPPEQATLFHYWPGQWGSATNSGALPQDGLTLPFKPLVWLGNEEGGLAWFMESDSNWSNAEMDNVIQVRRSAGAVTLRVKLVDQDTRLQKGEPRTYTFGLQATPVKPIPRDWHEWRICHCGSYDLVNRTYQPEVTLSYPAQGHIDVRQGTLEAWVIPQFDPRVEVDPQSAARGLENRNFFYLATNDPQQSAAGFYWNIDDRGMRFYIRQGDTVPLVLGAPSDWKRGEPHHIALTWGTELRIYIDGRCVASRPHVGLLGEGATLANDALLRFGGGRSDFVVDDLRISSIPRDHFELQYANVADSSTLLLDSLDDCAAFGAGEQTVATRTEGMQVTGGQVSRHGQCVPARFASGIALGQSGEPVPLLDHLAAQGVKTIVFHEHWTDIQNYTMVGHDQELKRLVEEVHRRGMKLLVYFGYELSSIAPEWNLYGHEVLIKAPESPLPATGYKREPPQHANIVCYNSPWQDFLADGIQRTLKTYKIDGVYLDGTIEPFGCLNHLHGCGFQRSDGQWGKTYPIFAVRNLMKRIYTMCTDIGGLVNPHQSTCCMIPTLSFSHSYWDGEQFGGGQLANDPLAQLPLETFRAEFMGRNWGVPAEFLVYERPPSWTMDHALAFSMLHDVCVRPGSVAALDRIAPIWRAWSEFGVQEPDCLFHPYWKNRDWVQATPETVRTSFYHRPGRGVLLVISNLGTETTEGCIRPVATRLGLDVNSCTARDALTGEPVPCSAGELQISLPPMRMRLIRLD